MMTPRTYLLLALLAFGQFALVTSVFMLAGMLESIASEFRVTVATAAQTISVFSLTYALSAPFLATLTAHCRPRAVLVVSTLMFAAANLAATTVQDFNLLLLCRILAAAADGLFAAVAAATASAIVPPAYRGRALAVVNIGVTLAFVGGVPLATWLTAIFDWRAAFWLVAAMALAAGLGLGLIRQDMGAPPKISLARRLSVVTVPGVVPTLLVTILSYSGLFTLYNFLGPLIDGAPVKLSWTLSGLLFLFGCATVVGNVVGGWASDRMGAYSTISISLLLLTIVLSARDLFFASEIGILLMLPLWGAIHYAALPPLQKRLADLAGPNAGLVLALNGSAVYIGVALGAEIGGRIVAAGSLEWIGPVGGALKLIALVILTYSFRAVLFAPAKLRANG